MTSEADLQVQIADYLRLQYPNVMFHSDYGSGIKLTMGQAIKQKRQNGGRRAWPDMFIAEHRVVKASCKVIRPEDSVIKEAQFIEQKHGLFVEIKKAGTRIYKKDGTLVADQHIREQFDVLEQLRKRGYMAEFACGFDEAKRIIDRYLGGK